MIIVTERKLPVTNTEKLKDIAKYLGLLKIAFDHLNRALFSINLKESYFNEGIEQQKEIAKQKLLEIQNYLNILNEVELVFALTDADDILPKQAALDKGSVPIPFLKNYLLEVWALRHVGETLGDKNSIKEKVLRAFSTVTGVINSIQLYTEEFNRNSKRKLRFNAYWRKFLKSVPHKKEDLSLEDFDNIEKLADENKLIT